MGLFLKTGYMYKNQNNLNLDSSFLSDTEYNRITNLRDLYYSQGKRNWRVHIFPVTYCKRQEVFKLKLADSAGVSPKAITFHLGWPGLPGKSRLFDGLAHGSHPSLRALGGGGWLTFRHVPPHVDQIRWLVGDCEGLQTHPVSWEPFTKCHAERLAGICILSPRGKSNYDWQIRKLGRLISCMLWQFMESKGFSLPARL